MTRFIGLLLVGLVIARLAAAQSAADGGSCRDGAFPSAQSDFSLARVDSPMPAALLEDMDGCPEKGESRCRADGSVAPGRQVIVGRQLGNYRCAFSPGPGGRNAGWMLERHLHSLPVTENPLPTSWVGAWRSGTTTLTLTENADGTLTASGRASWIGGRPGPHQMAVAHVGRVNASAFPSGNRAVFTDGSCVVNATLLNAVLVVADNQQCGGMNVNFDGVYQRH